MGSGEEIEPSIRKEIEPSLEAEIEPSELMHGPDLVTLSDCRASVSLT